MYRSTESEQAFGMPEGGHWLKLIEIGERGLASNHGCILYDRRIISFAAVQTRTEQLPPIESPLRSPLGGVCLILERRSGAFSRLYSIRAILGLRGGKFSYPSAVCGLTGLSWIEP